MEYFSNRRSDVGRMDSYCRNSYKTAEAKYMRESFISWWYYYEVLNVVKLLKR